MTQSADSFALYVNELKNHYDSLNNILLLEAGDIAEADEKKLEQHLVMERDIIRMITSLTGVVRTYMEQFEPGEDLLETMKLISKGKRQAEVQISENIRNLELTMSGIKKKIESVKLPKSARRVYYSGNNATIMDIEI